MKTAAFIALAAAELVAGHATFQFIAKNGGEQTNTGVRGTSDQNNPILSSAADLSSDKMICKGGAAVDGQFEVAGGDKLTLQWHHNVGTDGAGDKDEPIAPSHKGPILVYITPAETKGESGWVKIYEDGLTGTEWAVDKFYANKGKIEVTLPALKAGDYLLRSEIIALHEGNRAGKAQFYNGCGQLKVTGSGTVTLPAGVDIRTVYKTDDPGVLFDIYAGKTEYPIPGPKVFSGSGSGDASPAPAPAPSSGAAAPTSTDAAPPSAPTSSDPAAPPAPAPTTDAAPAPTGTAPPADGATTVTSDVTVTQTATGPEPTAPAPTTLVTSVQPAPSGGGDASGSAKKWAQCGGQGFSGPTACESGTTCQKQNDYYSQCL